MSLTIRMEMWDQCLRLCVSILIMVTGDDIVQPIRIDLLVCGELLEIAVGVDPVHHFLLFHRVRAQSQEQHRALQGLLPLGIVLQHRRSGVNLMVILGKFEGILFMSVVLRHEGKESDLVILHRFFLEMLPEDFSRHNVGPDIVLLSQRQSELLQNEFDLFPLR